MQPGELELIGGMIPEAYGFFKPSRFCEHKSQITNQKSEITNHAPESRLA
jgi:hypothetical protein